MADWERVLTTLVTERGDALKRYAFLLCGEDATAQDLVQDALVRAIGRHRPFAGQDMVQVEAYVRRIIVNLSIDQNRSLSRWRRFLPLLATPDQSPDPAARIATTRDMHSALRELSPRQRACVVLRYYEDLPIADIASALGCSDGTVKRHLSEATNRLAASFGPSQEGRSWPSTRKR